jgi:antitoxin component of RelBE/YafQ-DinJ toxin-antitoxin module
MYNLLYICNTQIKNLKTKKMEILKTMGITIVSVIIGMFIFNAINSAMETA